MTGDFPGLCRMHKGKLMEFDTVLAHWPADVPINGDTVGAVHRAWLLQEGNAALSTDDVRRIVGRLPKVTP